jgi:hypothetical protein
MFKYLGQHIFDFVSKFRNDVYLENLTEVEQEFTIQVAADGKLTKSTAPGERSRIQVRNDEGSVIPAGSPLYSRGEVGGSNRIKVGICVSSDSAKMPCIGIAEFEMNTSDTKDSFAVTQGVYNTNISGFTGLSEGDILYVNGGVAPHLTPTKPTNGDLIQNVGIVLKTNGTICQGLLVAAIGRTNDVPWPLYVDVPNNRVGIGTTSPSWKLDLNGGTENVVASFSSTDQTAQLRIVDSSNIPFFFGVIGTGAYITPTGATPADGISIKDTGNVGIGVASPTQKLQVQGSQVKFTSTTSGENRFMFSSGDDGNNSAFYMYDSQQSNTILINSGGNSYFNGGQLLLNATTTSFSDKLYINGDAYVNGGFRVGTSATYVGKLYNTIGILTLESDSTRDIQFGSVTNGTAMFIEGTNT